VEKPLNARVQAGRSGCKPGILVIAGRKKTRHCCLA